MNKCGMKKHLAALFASLFFALAVFSCPAYAYEQKEAIVSNGHGSISAQYLVVHETANPGASAWNHVVYWGNNSNTVSMTHYVMDLDGSVVYHTQADNRLAWHVGNGNYLTVGIELCHATNQADFNAQYSEAVMWVGDYLEKRGWGVDRLLSHNECRYIWGGTDHTDPLSYFTEYGKSWDEFECDVSNYMVDGEPPLSSGNDSSSVDIDALARAVIRGEYGDGEAREKALGAKYEAVQARVNELLS